MTVKQLRAILDRVADSAIVLTTAPDHSYREVRASVTTALHDEDSDSWSEDFEDDNENMDEERKEVIVIS